MKRLVILLALIAFSFSACYEGVLHQKAVRAIYVAGREGNVAKYWKNGLATSLTNGVNVASAESIFVSGNDVHVVGHEFNGTYNVAKYWKNGIVTNLSDGTSSADASSTPARSSA